jgi:diguanylate cyclase (GGDEF)-like protein
VIDSKLPGASALVVKGLRLDFWYALALFVAAAAALWIGIEWQGGVLKTHGPDVAAFFLIYGLVTISIGYPHPHFGYYSFDRVSQVASILVLGPVDAAWINGLASLLYPLQRLLRGVSPSEVLVASMNNAGMMTLMILLAGSLYASVGGPVPLTALSTQTVLLLLLLVVVMQLLNDLGMLGALRATGGNPEKFFNLFSVGLELGSAATAVLVALVFNRMDAASLALLLGVLTLGMLAIRQFANMRQRLERLVEERTQDLQAKTLELERQATRDTLTNLYNRRYADAFLDRHLREMRWGDRFVIALADIDFFKQINDGYSHAIGDDVLRRVADILRARCRKSDMISRYGGEEFLLCFPDTDLHGAMRLCETLRDAVEREDWSPLGLVDGVTLSFGIAARTADSTSDTLLRAADRHLYAAKRRGRNRVVA